MSPPDCCAVKMTYAAGCSCKWCRPRRAEIETELKELDALRLITGISNKITGEMRWRITDAGQAELSNQ